jgi:beta-lactamase class D
MSMRSATPALAATMSSIDVVLAPGLTVLIQDAGEAGVVAFEGPDGRTVTSDFERVRTPYVPASTFKIPHTVIALETGIAAGLEAPFKWDGEVRTLDGKPVDAWNRDQTLGEAFRNSTIWVYQEIARKVGAERMTRLLAAFDYGNRAIGEIDRFWLAGPLRISAREQIAFLGRLRAGTLPVSARAQALTREVMAVETTDAHVLVRREGRLVRGLDRGRRHIAPLRAEPRRRRTAVARGPPHAGPIRRTPARHPVTLFALSNVRGPAQNCGRPR